MLMPVNKATTVDIAPAYQASSADLTWPFASGLLASVGDLAPTVRGRKCDGLAHQPKKNPDDFRGLSRQSAVSALWIALQ